MLKMPYIELNISHFSIFRAPLGGLEVAYIDHAPAAFIPSYIASRSLVSQLHSRPNGEDAPHPQEVLDLLSTKVQEEVTLEGAEVGQKTLSAAIDAVNLEKLKREADEEGSLREVARLASLGLPQAGVWLLTAPVTALGLHLRGGEFVAAVKYQLGCPIYQTEGPCPACLRPSDRFGDHAHMMRILG